MRNTILVFIHRNKKVPDLSNLVTWLKRLAATSCCVAGGFICLCRAIAALWQVRTASPNSTSDKHKSSGLPSQDIAGSENNVDILYCGPTILRLHTNSDNQFKLCMEICVTRKAHYKHGKICVGTYRGYMSCTESIFSSISISDQFNNTSHFFKRTYIYIFGNFWHVNVTYVRINGGGKKKPLTCWGLAVMQHIAVYSKLRFYIIRIPCNNWLYST